MMGETLAERVVLTTDNMIKKPLDLQLFEEKDILFEIFSLGVDYGQYVIENEIFHENWADIMGGVVADKKFSMPSQRILREPHSKEWLEAKSSAQIKAMDIIVKEYAKKT